MNVEQYTTLMIYIISGGGIYPLCQKGAMILWRHHSKDVNYVQAYLSV